MRRRWLAVCACVLVGSGIPQASAQATRDGGPYRVQMIYRTGKSLAPFRITVTAKTVNGQAVWLATELQRRGRKWRVSTVGSLVGPRGFMAPTVYGGPGPSTPSCPDLPTQACDFPFGSKDAGSSWELKPGTTSVVYVVSAYMDGMKINVDSKGWRVKEVKGLNARRVVAKDADATGADALGTSIEHFTSASAPGGRYGSVVYASVPCGETGQGEARVDARGALHVGDMPPQPLQCRVGAAGGSSAYLYTPESATWRMTGDVTGVSNNAIRLLVFDFPKP